MNPNKPNPVPDSISFDSSKAPSWLSSSLNAVLDEFVRKNYTAEEFGSDEFIFSENGNTKRKVGGKWDVSSVYNTVYIYWEKRRPGKVFREGFKPQVLYSDSHMIETKPGAFHPGTLALLTLCPVGTTRQKQQKERRGGLIEYEIFAPGGFIKPSNSPCGSRTRTKVDGDEILGNKIVFPGGIKREFIRSATTFDDAGYPEACWMNSEFTFRYEMPDEDPPYAVEDVYVWRDKDKPSLISDQEDLEPPVYTPSVSDTGFEPDVMKSEEPPKKTRLAFNAPDGNGYIFVHGSKACRTSAIQPSESPKDSKLEDYTSTFEWPKELGQTIDSIFSIGGKSIALVDRVVKEVSFQVFSSVDRSVFTPPASISNFAKGMQDSDILKSIAKFDCALPSSYSTSYWYFFKGREYFEVILESGFFHGRKSSNIFAPPCPFVITDSGVIADKWKCLANVGFDTVEFCLQSPAAGKGSIFSKAPPGPSLTEKRTFFFRKDLYVEVDLSLDKLIAGPFSASQYWEGIRMVGMYE